MGAQNRGSCAGIHVNMPIAGPSRDQRSDMTDAERALLDQAHAFDANEMGYSEQQATRPQTLGYGLADSPSGQAGWILEKFHWSPAPSPIR